MTVCIAARCLDTPPGAGTIIGASDRMITSGDITFESNAPFKQVALTTSIVVMTAGDAAIQDEVIREVFNIVNQRVKAEPTNWWNVKEVAEIYVKFFHSAKAKRASNSILAPFGLDSESFLTRQHEMSENFVSQISGELINYRLAGDSDGVHTIITGIDLDGPHIYSIYDGYIVCCDSIGFAAIGSGARHSESQFMLNRHSWNASPTDTGLLTYIAKRRAEAAPGVGRDTDMFVIAGLGGYQTFRPDIMDKLQEEYQKITDGEQYILTKSKQEVKSYVETLVKESATSQGQNQDSTIEGQKPSSDGTTVSEPLEESQP